MSDYVPLIDGGSFTSQASASITGGELLVVSGDGTVAAASGASGAFAGVAGFDCSSGDKVTVYIGGVQRITNTGGVTAGNTLESASGGKVATHTEGTNDQRVVGVALNTATTGNLVSVLMTR